MNLRDTQETLLAEQISRLPYQEPPMDFAAGVMSRIAPRRAPLWRRLAAWATTPRLVAVSPARLLPVAALLMVAVWLGFGPAHEQPPHPQGGSLIPVTFVLKAPAARSVAVIGSFNDWTPRGFEMRRDASTGLWSLKAQLPPGSHEYVFLIDGSSALPDPRAVFTKDDGFGQRNSVLMIEGGHEIVM